MLGGASAAVKPVMGDEDEDGAVVAVQRGRDGLTPQMRHKFGLDKVLMESFFRSSLFFVNTFFPNRHNTLLPVKRLYRRKKDFFLNFVFITITFFLCLPVSLPKSQSPPHLQSTVSRRWCLRVRGVSSLSHSTRAKCAGPSCCGARGHCTWSPRALAQTKRRDGHS